MNSKKAAFVILINHASAPVRKEKLSPASKARREPAKMSLWKRAGCQTETKAFEKSIVERIVRDPCLGLLTLEGPGFSTTYDDTSNTSIDVCVE